MYCCATENKSSVRVVEVDEMEAADGRDTFNVDSVIRLGADSRKARAPGKYEQALESQRDQFQKLLDGHAEWVTCSVGDSSILTKDFEAAMGFLRSQQVGRNRILEGPFGPTCKVYMDYTASGQALLFISQYMHWVKQMFANAHTEDSATGHFMTEGMEGAIATIERCVNAGDTFKAICVGTGCTGAIQKLQQILGIYVPPAAWTKLAVLVAPGKDWDSAGEVPLNVVKAYPADPSGASKVASVDDTDPGWIRAREAVKAVLRGRGALPIVLVGGYEHHSNELSWRDGLCDYMRVPLTKDFEFDYAFLEAVLPKLRATSPDRLIIGSFSDCSNVTGMRTDIRRISAALRRHGCLLFVDYAASGPYTTIDCNRTEGSFDACFVSPHKFMGGEGSSGLLLLRKSLYKGSLPPTFGGGGTVKFVTPHSHRYSDDIVERESAGTPGVLQIMQTALAFEVKGAIGPENIERKEHELLKDFFAWLKRTHPKEIVVYGNQDPEKRHPIVSFNVVEPHALHPRFVTCLLSDLFGIQSRAGCSCAGPHGVDLFEYTKQDIDVAMQLIVGGGKGGDREPNLLSTKLGWCRINLHYTLDAIDIWYFKEALSFVVKHGYRFLSLYTFDLYTGSWIYTPPDERHGFGETPTHSRSQSLKASFTFHEADHSHIKAEEADLHSFGLDAALAGASSRIVKDVDREDLLKHQLERANVVLGKLPDKKVAPPPAPFPPVRIQGRPFFEVAEGMVRNREALEDAAKLLPKEIITGDIEILKAAMQAPPPEPLNPGKEASPAVKVLSPLLAADGSHGQIRRVGVKFTSVAYSVSPGWGKPPLQVLQDVSGICRSGEVLFLMGPHGAGKTMLLNCLSGHVKGAPTGEITFNGAPATQQLFRRTAQYCMEDAPFYEALTVEEHLMYAARLCCPSRAEARRRAEWVISVLGLSACRKSKVGGLVFRGISAGEHKRLAIGEKALVGAPVLFLDEPTSGLDASSALQVAQTLQVLASHNGTSIICSIHQPSERMLECVDHVLLLGTGGRQAYFGSPDGLEDHFVKALGEPRARKATPAEWALEMISAEVGGTDREERIAKAWAAHGVQKMKQLQCGASGASDIPSGGSPLDSFRHTAVLFERSMMNTLRNPIVIWVRLAMDVVLSLIIGTVWWDIGSDVSAGDVNNIAAVLFFNAAFQAFMSITSMHAYLEDRAVLVKEKASGCYNVVSYNVSAFLVLAPFLFLISIVCSAIIYPSLSLNSDGGRFAVYALNLFLTLLCADAVAFLVAAIVPIFIAALAACAFVFGTFMILQGFFIRFPDIPAAWRWLHWAGFHSYSFRTALFNEFDGTVILKDLNTYPPAFVDVNGEVFLKTFDFHDEDLTRNCLIMLGMAVVYRLIAGLWQHFFYTGKK